MKRIVGISDLGVSSDPDEELVTYGLGSCLAIVAYDPVARVGGLLHAMLPSARIDPEKAQRNPLAYVDTGVPELFRWCYAEGGARERLIVKVAGGATMQQGDLDRFQIGKRNVLMLRQLLWKNGILVAAEDVGGTCSRTLSLHIGTGRVMLKSQSIQQEL